MQITNAADRLAARLEAKARRRPWNPDLHPRDSKGRFIETGGVARLWGGGLARVIRSLGGRNVLVESLTTHQRSTIHGSRLTMVARPDGSAPTKSKKKVRDEDERRVSDGRRGTGLDDDDAGDQGDTPDAPHDKDDQGEDIGADFDGEDLGETEPEPEDDEPFLPRGRVFRNGVADTQNPEIARYGNALPMPGNRLARHRAGQGDALRAPGGKKTQGAPNRHLQFRDADHANDASNELVDDYLAALANAWEAENWDDGDAADLYERLSDTVSDVIQVDNRQHDRRTRDQIDWLPESAAEAEALAELADHAGKTDVAEAAATLADALDLAHRRFTAHGDKPLRNPRKNGPARPSAWQPTPVAPAKKTAAKRARRDPNRRFKSLGDVRAHWTSDNVRPFTTSERRHAAHIAALPSLMDKLEKPQLSHHGHFTIGKLPAKKPSDGPYGWAVTHNDTGIRLVLTPRKAEALDFANRMETAELNGKPINWDDPSAFDAFRSKEGMELAERLKTESQQAFANRAAKKRDGATARTKPAPSTPESSAQTAQSIAAQTGIPASNIGVGHIGAAGNAPQGRPANSDELRALWANGGTPDVSAPAARTMRQLADSSNVKLHLSDHRGFAIVEYIRNSGDRFEIRASGTGQRLMVNPVTAAGVFADEDTANRFALRIGSEIRDADGKTIDWGSPTLDLKNWRSKDSLGIRPAVLEVAAQFDVDRGAHDSPMVKRAQARREHMQRQAEAAAGTGQPDSTPTPQPENSPTDATAAPSETPAPEGEQPQNPAPADAGGKDPVKTHLDRASVSLGPVMNELRDDQRWGQRLGRAIDQTLGGNGDREQGFDQLESVIEEGRRRVRSNRALDSSERRYLDQFAADALAEVREARKLAADRPKPPRPGGQRRPDQAEERRSPSQERAIAVEELDVAVDQVILAQRGTLQDDETSRSQVERAQALLAAVRDGETDSAADLGEILGEVERGIRGRTDGLDETAKRYWLNELSEARQALMRAEARLGDIEPTGTRRTPPADTGADSSEQVRPAGTSVLDDVPSGGAAVPGQRAAADGVLRGAGEPDSGEDRGSGGDADEEDAAGDDAGDGGLAGAGPESGDGTDPGRGAVPAEGAGDGESGAGRDAAAAVDPARFRPGSQDDLAPSGERTKAKANVAAVRTLRRIQAENRPATPEEQKILARWSGWGSLPIVLSDKPNPNDNRFRDESGEPNPEAYARALKRWESYAEERAEIRELLDDNEWAAARKNTLNAHYTDSSLVQPVWDAIRSLGFRRGRVLEPGSGSGNFIGHAPDGAQMVGVELDPTSAAISQLLYPDAQVINKPFQDLRLPPDSFDLAIGNVPFGKYKLHDPLDNPGRHHSIHDHFILKSLARVRPGGYVALVTSRYTLDSEDESARRAMYDMADLVGAVRLPEGAHQRAAGTHVVTDLLLFRRRGTSHHTSSRGDDSWLTSSKTDIGGYDIPVNNYFQKNPKNVLGQMTVGFGQFTDHDLTVKGDSNTLVSMRAALGRIVADAKAAGSGYDASQQNADLSLNLAGDARDGSIARGENGAFMTVENGNWVELDVHPKQREQLGRLLHLKELANQLVGLEASTRQTGETTEMREARAALNLAYDTYVRKHPSPNKPAQNRRFSPPEAVARRKAEGLKETPDEWKLPTALSLFEEDPDGHMVFGLDRWDADAKAPRKLDILSERVLQPREIPYHADTPELAVTYALEHDGGRLNLSTVARLLGKDQDAAREALGDLAFDDPATGRLEPRAAYLSGNVRQKLVEAQAAAAEDPKYAVNVAALERVVPKDIRAKDIRVKIGAPWVPIDIYEGFLRHLGLSDAQVTHHGGNRWSVDGEDRGEIARKVWGVKGRNAYDIFNSLLHQKLITVKETQEFPDGSKKTFVNQKATSAARTKAKDMAREFQKWAMADPERAGRLGRIYNDKFNSIALRDYDDSPLTLPGIKTGWRMRPHQNAAIRRITQEPTTLLGHVVGAGKTATMVGGAMELRRTGLAKKPAIVVPNHMLEQFSRETVGLYPGAKVLAISRKDLHHKKRRKFIAKIAGGDWDVVVLTHDAFNAMPMTPHTQQAYMDKELALLRSQIEKIKDRDGDDPSLKQMEQTLANQEEKLKERLATLKDQRGIFFENTGIDYLFVDEAHEYKNLRTVSNLPGAAISGSGQATQLHMALGYLREHNESGRVATLATGTPIANSVTEAYVLMRYLAPQILEDAGIDDFDSWAATFGEVVTSLELAPNGSGEYREKARFAKFFNVPELLVGYRTFADIQTAADLGLPTPPVRAGKNGRRGEVIPIPASIEQRRYVESLAEEDWIKDPGGVLKAIGFASRAAIDMRLQGGSGHEGGKLDAAAEQIAQLYEEHKDTVYPVSLNNLTPQETPGGLQLVFLDEGTPGSTGKIKFDAYETLRDLLVEQGVPREKIRFIHEAKDDKAKAKLFEEARNGKVAVLIGSTQKMGTGTNVQDRAVALHHLSFPWRPADMEQRDGRIERQGNLNVPMIPAAPGMTPDDVRIMYYITEGTFDEFRLGTLERKAVFINQMARRDFNAREMEDIGDAAVSLGTFKAIASGNPAIAERALAQAELVELQRQNTDWYEQQQERRDRIEYLTRRIGALEQALPGMREALVKRQDVSGDRFQASIDGVDYDNRADAAEVLGRRMDAIAKDTRHGDGSTIPLGEIGEVGFLAEVEYDRDGNRLLRLRLDHAPAYTHSPIPETRGLWSARKINDSSGRGAIQSLENLLRSLDSDIKKRQKELDGSRTSRREAEEHLAEGTSPYEEQVESTERRMQALTELVMHHQEARKLTDRIKEATNNADAAQLKKRLKEVQQETRTLESMAEQERAKTFTQPEPEAAPEPAEPKPDTPAPPASRRRRPQMLTEQELSDELADVEESIAKGDTDNATVDRHAALTAERAHRAAKDQTRLDRQQVRDELAALGKDTSASPTETGSADSLTSATSEEAAVPGDGDVKLDPDQVRSELNGLQPSEETEELVEEEIPQPEDSEESGEPGPTEDEQAPQPEAVEEVESNQDVADTDAPEGEAAGSEPEQSQGEEPKGTEKPETAPDTTAPGTEDNRDPDAPLTDRERENMRKAAFPKRMAHTLRAFEAGHVTFTQRGVKFRKGALIDARGFNWAEGAGYVRLVQHGNRQRFELTRRGREVLEILESLVHGDTEDTTRDDNAAPQPARPEAVRPFTSDAEWRGALTEVEGVQGNVSRMAEVTWGRDDMPDTVKAVRDAVFEAIAAQETGDYEDAAGSLAAAREHAQNLGNSLVEADRAAMEGPLDSFAQVVDNYLARHAVTAEKRRREDEQRDRIEREAEQQFRESLNRDQQAGATPKGAPDVELPKGQRWAHRDDVRPGDVVRFYRDGEVRDDAVLIEHTLVPQLLEYSDVNGRSKVLADWRHHGDWVAVVDKGPDRAAGNRYIKHYGEYMRNRLAENLKTWEEHRQNKNGSAQASPAAPEGPAVPGDGPIGEESPETQPAESSAVRVWKLGDWVVTPNGEGRVILVEEGQVIVLDGGGAPRTYEPRQLSLPGEARTDEHDAPTAKEAARREKRQRDLEVAQSSEGLKLFYGSRLANLNLEEGHGLVLDEDGNQVGWVRRRGNAWLGQDARGGLPRRGAAESASDPLHAPREAAGEVDGERRNGEMPILLKDRSWRHLQPEEGRDEVWYSEFSDAQREEFFRLVKEWVGSPDPELSKAARHWGTGLNYQQMHRLADEFATTANSVDTSTAEGRRRQGVLQRAADKVRAQARRAWLNWQSVPPPGEPDAVGNEDNPKWKPYGHRGAAREQPGPESAAAKLDTQHGHRWGTGDALMTPGGERGTLVSPPLGGTATVRLDDGRFESHPLAEMTPVESASEEPTGLPDDLDSQWRALADLAPDAPTALIDARGNLRQAAEALAAGDQEAASGNLGKAARRTWPLNGGDSSDWDAAARAFSVAADHAAARLMPLREGERLATYGELKKGDIVRRPGSEKYHRVNEDARSRDRDFETWFAYSNLASEDGRRGGFGFQPTTHSMIVADESSPAVREYIAGEERKLADKQAETERNAAEREARRQEAARARNDQLMAQADGDAVEPDALSKGDQITVHEGRNNRGQVVTVSGRLLAEPEKVTATRNGKKVPSWRLYVGEEGDELRPGTMYTIERGERVERHTDTTPTSVAPDGAGQTQPEGGSRSRRRGDRDGAAPDEASGNGGDDGTSSPDADNDGPEGGGREDEGDAGDSDSEQRRDRRRDRDHDKNQGERDGGAPNGGLPDLPGRDRDRDRGEDDDDRSPNADGPGGLNALKNRYRSGGNPAPAGADEQEHAAYLRRLADNDILTLSPGGGLITWSDDDGRTWEFGHAASGVHLAGWEAIGEMIGGRDGAVHLADAYEQLRDENGDPIDWSTPELDAQSLWAWRDAEGNDIGAALDQARQTVMNAAPGFRRQVGQDDASAPSAGEGRREPSGAQNDGQQSADSAADSSTGGGPADSSQEAAHTPEGTADSQYVLNALHGTGQRGGTVDGRRVPTAKEMEQYKAGPSPNGVVSEEGERALFGSPERMRALAAEGTVPKPVMRVDHDGQIWRDGRLIGTLFAPHLHTPGGPSPEGEWWSEPPFATGMTKFASREAAIAHLVLRDKERGEPDLSVVHPDLAWDMRTTAQSQGFPGKEKPFRGLETLADNPVDLERYYALRAFVDELGRGVTPSGNVADDLAHLHDELRWLDATHYKHQQPNLKDPYILGPGWLADKLRKDFDVLRPEDPRAQHHDASRNRAAHQFLEELLENGGMNNAVRVPISDIREGDIVKLDGRITGQYAGYTGSRLGYVVGGPTKATFTADGVRYKGYRVTVSKDLFAGTRHAAETDTFIIPADGGTALRLANAKDVNLPFNQHRYGRQIGESPRAANDPAPYSNAPEAERRGDTAATPAAASTSEPKSGTDVQQPADRTAPAAASTTTVQPPAEPGADRPARSEEGSGGRRADEPASTPAPTPETPAAPEPVGGRPAEWVQVSDLQLRDLVRVDGVTKRGTARTLAGHVVGGPKLIPVTKKGRATDMYRVLVADSPDARTGNPVYVVPDAAVARATRDDADQFQGSPQTGADSDVLTGRIADNVPTDARGNGLFPGSLVTDDDGKEGMVTGASANSVRVQFGDDRTDDEHAPTSVNVTDGGAARPTGWTSDGRRVDTGNVVGDRDGNMLGTVEDVDGDTATVATLDGMQDIPISGLRVRGDTAEADDPKLKVTLVEAVSKVDVGDVILIGPDKDRAVRVTGFGVNPHRDEPLMYVVDTTTGKKESLPNREDGHYIYHRLVGADGTAPDLGPEDAADSGEEITSHEPAPSVDPVTNPTVDPQLSPEERDAITDRGQVPASAPDAQQASARIANDLPVTPEQATALAGELREGADTATPEGRAAQRAADSLDTAAGNNPGDVDQAEPGTVGSVGVGDTIVLPDEFDADTMTAYRIVQIREAPGGVRVLTVEDGDGLRFKRSLASSDLLYQLPKPEAPAAAGDVEQRDPNPAPDTNKIRADYADTVVRAVIDSALNGTTTPGSIHQLRQQIAERLTPEALRAAMRRARNEAVAAITNAGFEGQERSDLVQSLRREAARARTDAVRAAVRTLDDLEPLDGESEEDTASRAADLLRLIPEALRTRATGDDNADGETSVNDDVTQHASNAVGEALQAAADSGELLTPQRSAVIVRKLASRMDSSRDATAQRIVTRLPEGQRTGVLPHILAGLAAIARMIIALVAAFLEALAKAWRAGRENLRRMRARVSRFRQGLMRRMRSWPETRRLRRLAAAGRLPQHANGLPLGDRIAHWARLLPAPGRFGQVSRRARWYQPTSRSSLAAGQLPEVQDGVRWTMDRSVDGGPGPQALRHLAAVRAAGQDVDTDVVARLSAAAPELGDDPHGTVRHAAAYADTAERRLRDLEAAAAGGTPDADLEVAAARVEAQSARQEASRLRQAYAAALPDAVRGTLAEVREMGPGTTATLTTTPGSDPDAVRALTGIAQFVPRDWLSAEARPLTARSGDAGGYDPASRTATVADLGDNGRRTAAHALLMHLQQHYPDLLAAQEAFHFTRTHSGRVGARRRTPLDRLLARLFRGSDGQGDTRDLVPLGLATLFDGQWYEDDDLRAFLLGLLATR